MYAGKTNGYGSCNASAETPETSIFISQAVVPAGAAQRQDSLLLHLPRLAMSKPLKQLGQREGGGAARNKYKQNLESCQERVYTASPLVATGTGLSSYRQTRKRVLLRGQRHTVWLRDGLWFI
jgi:hypothetical protein